MIWMPSAFVDEWGLYVVADRASVGGTKATAIDLGQILGILEEY